MDNENRRTGITALLIRYERHLSALAFVGGFVFDNLFAPSVDEVSAPLFMGLFLFLAAVFITCLQLVEAREVKGVFASRMSYVLPHAIQFLFGGLMSVLFVYYSRSASLAGTWPFMLFLGAMFLGNEVFRSRLMRLEFQLISFFFTLFMAVAVCLPVFLHKLGIIPFLISGVVSIGVTLCFMLFLLTFVPRVMKKRFLPVFGLVFALYLLINGLYVAHLIPPIPLSLRAAGVYHLVTKDAMGNYQGSGEPRSWKDVVGMTTPIFHRREGEPVYFYSAVFAPVTISTPIEHVWEYKDPITGVWNSLSRVTFPVSGGRDGGYRGYSIKENISDGTWRVSVGTAQGELLGRETFVVTSISTGTTPTLITKEL